MASLSTAGGPGRGPPPRAGWHPARQHRFRRLAADSYNVF